MVGPTSIPWNTVLENILVILTLHRRKGGTRGMAALP